MDHNATPHATPAQLRLLELQQEEVHLNASKVQGLFQYLNFTDSAAFDRCLGHSVRAGVLAFPPSKAQKAKYGAARQEPRLLSRAPDGGPTPRKYATITTSSQNRKVRQGEASRSVMIMAQRKEPAALTSEETLARLKNVFLAYTDPMLYAHTGRREMNIVGFCRLMRDCRLLDNRLTLVAADVIFTRVDAGSDVDGSNGSTILGDMHVDYEEFMRCLRAVVRVKFPKAADPQEAMLLLARKWVLPFARDSGAGGGVGNSVDGLFSRSTMNLIRKYDGQLKKLFAWYSSMDETDPARVTWTWAREHSGAINSSQFVLMLLNFGVLPVLLSKHAALEVFVRCEAANDGDERANAMYYPAFLETIAEVAMEVGKYALPRIRAATSPDELKMLRRYAECCPPPHGPKVMEVYLDALASRGRDASTLDQHALYDAEAAFRENEKHMAQALQRQMDAQATGVVQRREGMRQRFALTRLRNFYRDVRTFNNNTTWPPERDVSPTNPHRNNPGPIVGDGSEAEGVHVAFYDSERCIKTPKPVWLPVGNPAGRRHSHGPEAPSPSGAAAAATVAPGGPNNFLLLESPSAAAAAYAARQSIFLSSGANAKSTGVHGAFMPSSAGAYYVRSPKPYQIKVSIEDRDEHEAILDLAGRLPYICLPSGQQPPEASTSTLHLYGKPRAVTAPAELRRRRESDGLSPSGGGPGPGAGQEGAGMAGERGEGEAEGCGAEPSSTSTAARARLPPVQHQLHRAQATAAAMAVIAGQPPPNPYCLTQQASSLHLPPAYGAGQLHAMPSAASVPTHHGAALGPSPSQLNSLGVGSYSPNNSQRFSPHTSLSRRRQSHRKRGDVGGLPNLQLPPDSGPSTEVAAALTELDRFDNARTVGTASGVAGGGSGPWRQEQALHA